MIKSSDSAFTYSVDSRYHFTRDAMVYGRIATGYRPGGANIADGSPTTFKPDTTTNYELGVKSEWLNRKLLFDADIFYITWDNIHVLQRSANLLNTFTGNGGTATSKGVELNTHYQVLPELQVGVNGAYIDATFNTVDPAIGSVDGTPLPNSPKWTGSLFSNWTHPLSNGYVLTAGASWIYVGSRMSDFPAANPAGIRLKSYATLNLNAGISNAQWKFNAYVRNATDEKAILTRRNFGAVVLEPTVVGLSVDRNF